MMTMRWYSERLELCPLNKEQLQWHLNSSEQLQTSLGLSVMPEALDEHMKKVYNLKIERITNSPNEILFHTYYAIILKSERRLIGNIGLKGLADEESCVEVGYWIHEADWGNGYMTEALGLFLSLFAQLQEVKGVRAFTSCDNKRSHRVLKKNGFYEAYKYKDMIMWYHSLKE